MDPIQKSTISDIACKQAGVCGGCPWIKTSLSDQRKEKIKSLKGLFPEEKIHIASLHTRGLRDRVDLTIKRMNDGSMGIGLWRVGERGELLDMQECPMMSEPLEAWFKEFRSHLPPINLGSVRLRVSPQGLRGAWLDLSNEDVKHLFEEQEYLKWLAGKAVVEIGQKKKPLYFEDGRPRLSKQTELKPWFETVDLEDRTYPISTAIGGFSQTGFSANKVLVKEVLGLVAKAQKDFKVSNWLEAFCGSGNFTYPLSKMVNQLLAFENDPSAIESLQQGLKDQNIKNVLVKQVDLKSTRQIEALLEHVPQGQEYGLLADPPRSGLMRLKDFLQNGTVSPKIIIYVSCFSESLIEDAEELKQLGYELESLSLVDQFVHSPHVEWVTLWTKKIS